MTKTVFLVMGMRSNKFGGLERFNAAVCNELNKHDVKVMLIYEEMPTAELYLEQLKASNATVIVMPARGKNCLSFAFRFTKLLLTNRPDVVHCNFDPAGYIAQLLSFIFGIKSRPRSYLSMICNSKNEEVTSLSSLPLKTQILRRLSYSIATQAYPDSDGIANQYLSLFNVKKKIERFYLGVSANNYPKSQMRQKYGFDENAIIITCIAFHSPVKGVDILLDAIKILVSKNDIPIFKLCLIGKGDDTEKLQAYAVENDIDKYIYWMGLQNNVPEILAASDIYVQPSRSEGLSLALFEASMAGLPLIGTDVGGIPEAVTDGETGLLVEVCNPTDLADKLYMVLTDEKLRNKLGSAARERAMTDFNIEIQSKLMVQKYLEE